MSYFKSHKVLGFLIIVGTISILSFGEKRTSQSKSIIFLKATPPDVPSPSGPQPFVTLFGDDYFRGAYYHHFLGKDCKNLPSTYNNWASSVNPYDRCVYLCELKDCEGRCQRVHGEPLDRLHPLGMNDKISSLKFCYTYAERG